MNLLDAFLNKSKGKILRLYTIIDESTCLERGIPSTKVFEICLEEGIRLFQYRNKIGDLSQKNLKSRDFLKNIENSGEYCLILNDDWKLALERKFPVHLGQDDLPGDSDLKKIVEMIGYGASTHNRTELERIRSLGESGMGTSYTAFGAVFPSRTKPDVAVAFQYLDEFYETLGTGTSVLIGGINLSTLPSLVSYFQKELSPPGRDVYFAVVSGIFEFGNSEREIRRCLREYAGLIRDPLFD